MREFAEFRDALQSIWPFAVQLQQKSLGDLDSSDWKKIELIFCSINCMASSTSLVGNSKVMAHLMPNLIPPVDREYTLKFLFRHGQIANGIEGEWKKMLQILLEFFYPIAQSAIFQSRATKWMACTDQFRWDTSPLKIIDNLVIGVSKMNRATKVVDENKKSA